MNKIISIILGFTIMAVIMFLIDQITNIEKFMDYFMYILVGLITSFVIYQELFTDNGIKGARRRSK